VLDTDVKFCGLTRLIHDKKKELYKVIIYANGYTFRFLSVTWLAGTVKNSHTYHIE